MSSTSGMIWKQRPLGIEMRKYSETIGIFVEHALKTMTFKHCVPDEGSCAFCASLFMLIDAFLIQPDPYHHIQICSGENAPEANKRDGVFAQREGERESKGEVIAGLHLEC